MGPNGVRDGASGANVTTDPVAPTEPGTTTDPVVV
jgi:hypothetical protein